MSNATAKPSLVETLAAGADGLTQMKAMLNMGLKAGIAETMKFDVVEISDGVAVFASTPGEHLYNPIGTVHGGYAATLLDSACGCACHTKLQAGQAYTTVEIKVAYHKAITKDTGPLRAEGRVISIGRKAAFTEAKLVDAKGKLYASATSTLLIFAAGA